VSAQPQVAYAQLVELKSDFSDPKAAPDDKTVTVQFNPETLKVSYANQIAQPRQAGNQSQPASHQFVGAGTTKLALTIWFDVTAPPLSDDPNADVRSQTQNVAYFMTPKPQDGSGSSGGGSSSGGAAPEVQLVPPAVRFKWGSFQFDGTMESLDETLEFWSPDGRPLRASMNLSLSKPSISAQFLSQAAAQAAGATGARPFATAGAGASLQAMADLSGGNWQAIAQANGIENPRSLAPGQLVDLRASVKVGIG
jgi:Contractile injection system tube protein